MTILARMVEVNLTEKIHLGKDLKKTINTEGAGHEGIIEQRQCKGPVLSHLQDGP